MALGLPQVARKQRHGGHPAPWFGSAGSTRNRSVQARGAMPSGGSWVPGPLVVLANERAGKIRCAGSVCRAVAQGLAFSPAPCDI